MNTIHEPAMLSDLPPRFFCDFTVPPAKDGTPSYIRLHREWQQGIETGQEWESVDIPFRSLLGWAMRQTPEHEERFKELDLYFQNFHETSRK